MGWCKEFGLQVTESCDHEMIAGHDACSCPDCATVCRGRFAGCPMVWSEVPVAVGVRSPVLALGSVPTPALPAASAIPVATNGKSAGTAITTVTPAPIPAGAVGAVSGEVSEVSAVGAVGAIGDGPGERQELQDLRELCADLKLEVRRLNRMVERLADSAPRASKEAVLRDVDARFEWLTSELSGRLVTLGNEIAAIKRYLVAGPLPGPEPEP